jgi:prolyl oligopeptidase
MPQVIRIEREDTIPKEMVPVAKNSDPYLWLEKLDDPKVAKWYSKRNNATRELLSSISNRLQNRIKKYYALPYALFIKTRPNGYFVLLRDGQNFKLNLIDPKGDIIELVNSAELGKHVVLQQFYASSKGDIFAFTYSFGGSDEGFLRVMKTDSKDTLDEMKGMFGDLVWLNEKKYYYGKFYQKEKTPDGVNPPTMRIFLREDGTDQMVFGKGIPTSYSISFKSSIKNSKALLTVAYGWTRSDIYAGRIEKAENWNMIYGKGEFMTWPIDFVDGRFYLASFDRKGMGRILVLNGKGESEEIVSEQLNPLQEAVIAKGKIVATYLVDASSIIRTFRIDGKKHREIKPEQAGTIGSLDSDGEKCVFTYESFSVPYRIYRLENDNLTVIDSKEIPGDFTIQDLWVRSKDSTKIHVFKVNKKGKSTEHVLAWGYGGFAFSATPRYFPYVIPFLEDNGTFVVANLRGGTEYGEEWHRKGMREKKQHVFDDFIAVLEYFRKKGSKTIAFGVSNGGLLVGAILTQRPELVDGALIGYPVLDMLRYHNLHIGKAWVPEYGDPDNPRDREFLQKYSPYHNITNRSYPPVMLYTGAHDDRVHPAHAYKFAAKLEEVGASPLLRVETKSGHSGATPATKIKEYSDTMAFVYKTLAIKARR